MALQVLEGMPLGLHATEATTPVPDQISHRAMLALKNNKDIGLFEWCIFALLFRRRVHLFLGEDWVVIPSSSFLPGLEPDEDSAPVYSAHCALRRFGSEAEPTEQLFIQRTLPGGDPSSGGWATHWVILIPDQSGASAGSVTSDDLATVMCARGFLVQDVRRDGNCGIEVMLHFLGKSTDNTAMYPWLRGELSKAMNMRRHDPDVMEAFAACGEQWDSKDEILFGGKVEVDPEGSLPEPVGPLVIAEEGPSEISEDQMAAARWSTGGVRDDKGARDFWLACVPEVREHLLFNFQEQQRLSQDDRVKAIRLHLLTKRTMGTLVPKRKATPLKGRLSLGKEFKEWEMTDAGKEAVSKKRGLKAFCLQKFNTEDKSVRMMVHRAKKLAVDPNYMYEQRGRKDNMRLRRASTGGRPVLEPQLDIRLFDWWIDYRRLTRGRIHCSTILHQATVLLGEFAEEAARQRLPFHPPRLSIRWVQRWRERHSLSLRKPNRRFKVGREELIRRLREFWHTLFRARAFLTRLRGGREPVLESADQKGFYFNEGGSHSDPTLAPKGEVDVNLIENHANSRKRFSVMTHCVSQMDSIPGRIPPLGFVFKGETERSVSKLVASYGKRAVSLAPPEKEALQYVRYSAQAAPKASFRTEHVVRWIHTHLQPWTLERERDLDYRILFLDAFKAHLDEKVFEAAWERKYFLVIIPGGATPIVQGPDTDVHAVLSTRYRAQENATTIARLASVPNRVPPRSAQDCVDDLVAVWEALDHERLGKQSFWYNGLANSFDGKEDAAISETRPAKKFWTSCAADEIRAIEKGDVDDMWPVWMAEDGGQVRPERILRWKQKLADQPVDCELEGEELHILEETNSGMSADEELADGPVVENPGPVTRQSQEPLVDRLQLLEEVHSKLQKLGPIPVYVAAGGQALADINRLKRTLRDSAPGAEEAMNNAISSVWSDVDAKQQAALLSAPKRRKRVQAKVATQKGHLGPLHGPVPDVGEGPPPVPPPLPPPAAAPSSAMRRSSAEPGAGQAALKRFKLSPNTLKDKASRVALYFAVLEGMLGKNSSPGDQEEYRRGAAEFVERKVTDEFTTTTQSLKTKGMTYVDCKWVGKKMSSSMCEMDTLSNFHYGLLFRLQQATLPDFIAWVKLAWTSVEDYEVRLQRQAADNGRPSRRPGPPARAESSKPGSGPKK